MRLAGLEKCGSTMIVDTNVLLRAWADDDKEQARQARSEIAAATKIVIPNLVLCEFVWAARQVYQQKRAAIVQAIRLLLADERIVADWPAVEAGLSFMDAGGDFADGVIDFEGRRLGGSTFATFDRKAAAIIRAHGRPCVLLESE